MFLHELMTSLKTATRCIGPGLILLALGCATRTGEGAETRLPSTGPARRQLHVLNDVTHVYNFFLAWNSQIGRAYLPKKGQFSTANHRTIRPIDFEPFNVFWMPFGNNRDLPYLPGDAEHVEKFVRRDGGGVFLYEAYNGRNMDMVHANAFLAHFGVRLTTDKITKPIKATDHELAKGIEIKYFRGGHVPRLDRPEDWEVLFTDAAGKPLVAVRPLGKGRLVASGINLLNKPRKTPDGKRAEAANLEIIQRLLEWASANKRVPPAQKMPFKLPPEKKLALETITVWHSAYMQPYAEKIGKIYEALRPHMEAWMGVPLAVGKARLDAHLLATGGGGWSVGHTIGLGAFWGGFPEKASGMIGLIGHELNHSWVLPHSERLGNEGIAIYAGFKMGILMGHKEAQARLAKKVEQIRAHKHFKDFDPLQPLTDEVRKKCGGVCNGKYMVILWDLEAKYGQDIVAKYFRLKRKFVPAKGYRFTCHDSAWLYSKAAGEDVFAYLQSIGVGVEPKRVTLPAALEKK